MTCSLKEILPHNSLNLTKFVLVILPVINGFWNGSPDPVQAFDRAQENAVPRRALSLVFH